MNDFIDVAAYGRNSDNAQKTSQEIQDDDFTLFAVEGFMQLLGKPARIIENYKDHGKSASKKKSLHKRHDFHRMLADMEAGVIRRTGAKFPSYILILNTSRFSRLHQLNTLALYNRLRERNVKLVTVDDRMVYTFDKLEEIIRLLFKADNDNAYAKTVSLNALRGNARAARLGRCHQRFPPYGMMKLVVTDDKEERIIPRTKAFNKPKDWQSYLIPGDPIEQDVLRAMFTMFRDRDVSYSEMVRFFTTHPNLKYRLGPTGDGWHEQTVKHILGNLHYAGYEFIGVETSGEHHRFCGEQVIVAEEFKENDPLIVDITQPGIGHPKQGIIVDRETLFWPVQEKLKRRAAQPTKPKTSTLNPDGYALTGIVRCGNCGKPMYGHHNQGRGTLYTCKSARKGICGFWSVKEDDILPWLLAKIDMEVWRQLEAKPELPEACDDHSAVADDIGRLDRKIAVLKGKINAADDPDVIDSMADLLAAAIKQRKELEAQATKINRVEQLLLAQDRWEGFITPMLVPVKTGSVGAGEAAMMDELGIEQGEVDRLLNYTLVRPSSVRETLRSYNTEVKLWFKEAPQGPQATGHRKQWDVDMGRLDAKIGSLRLTPDTCLTGELGRSAAGGSQVRVRQLDTCGYRGR